MESVNKFILLLLAPSSVVLAACGPRSEYFGNVEPPAGNVFRFTVGAEPEYLDPGRSTALYDARVSVLLFEGLTAKDPRTLRPRPGVAERWDISEDGRTYTFHIRKNALWSDGHPVTAHDFVYSWTRVLDPKTGARYAGYLYAIANAEAFNQGKLKDAAQLGFRAIDDSTLEVRLNAPVPYFLYLTAFETYCPVPRRVLERYGDHWTDPSHIVTDGPFLLREHRPHDRLVLERNPSYWNAQELRIDRIIAYVVDDQYTATNMYEAGMVDWLPYGGGGIPPDFLPYMRGRFRDLKTFPLIATIYYDVNVARPPLNNPVVRRALSLAIDRREITDGLLRAGDLPASNFVPVGFPGYPAPPPPEYDPKRAAALLAEAGFPNGRGFPELEIVTPPDRRKVAEAMQQLWARNLNLHFSIHSEEFASFLKRAYSHDFDLASSRWIGDYLDPTTFTDLLESTNANNFSGWKNPDYDRLVAQARLELDPVRRLNQLHEAETLMLAQAPVIPFYTMAANELVKPYVRGIYPATWDVLPLNFVSIDHQWRAHAGQKEAGRD